MSRAMTEEKSGRDSRISDKLSNEFHKGQSTAGQAKKHAIAPGSNGVYLKNYFSSIALL